MHANLFTHMPATLEKMLQWAYDMQPERNTQAKSGDAAVPQHSEGWGRGIWGWRPVWAT